MNTSVSTMSGKKKKIELLPFIYVKVFLRDKQGKEDYFTTPIRLTEDEVHKYYVGRWWNMGIEDDYLMLCYKIEILHPEESENNEESKQ